MPIEATDSPVKRATTLWRHDALTNRHAVEAQERAHKRTTAARAHGHERQAFTINEFCWSHGISRATYYNLRERGLAPNEMRVLGKILITIEAAARWRKRAASRT
jgi:hypothetical protein